jgi:capsular polysaccharide biosynthesis protein
VSFGSFIRAYWPTVAMITALTLAGAVVALMSRGPTWESKAQVLVQSERLPNGTAEPPDMLTEKTIALSQNVADRAAAMTRSAPSDFADGLDVAVKPDSHVLDISYRAGSAESAYVGASAFSRAYIDYRNQVAADAAGRTNVPHMTELITPASRPSGPATVKAPLILGLSALVGLALGFLVSVAIDRLTGRIRSEEQAAQLTRRPVLGTVSSANASALPFPGREASPAGAETFGNVAARFVQGLDGRKSGALLVTAPTGHGPSSTVALNTAAALAEAGRETVLIRLNVSGTSDFGGRDVVVTDDPDDDATPPLFDVADVEGAEKSPVRRGWAKTPLPKLYVYLVHVNGSADGDVAADLQASMTRIAGADRLVVVDGQPVLGGSLTPLVALACDATVLAVDVGRDRRDQVAAASVALAHVANVVGCILVRPNHQRPSPIKSAERRLASMLSTS